MFRDCTASGLAICLESDTRMLSRLADAEREAKDDELAEWPQT
jgi:hypothetical protein